MCQKGQYNEGGALGVLSRGSHVKERESLKGIWTQALDRCEKVWGLFWGIEVCLRMSPEPPKNCQAGTPLPQRQKAKALLR